MKTLLHRVRERTDDRGIRGEKVVIGDYSVDAVATRVPPTELVRKVIDYYESVAENPWADVRARNGYGDGHSIESPEELSGLLLPRLEEGGSDLDGRVQRVLRLLQGPPPSLKILLGHDGQSQLRLAPGRGVYVPVDGFNSDSNIQAGYFPAEKGELLVAYAFCGPNGSREPYDHEVEFLNELAD